jgi:hypothetical protein
MTVIAASPTQQLTDRLIKRLIEAKLIRAESVSKISDNILAEKMTGSDWRMELELANGKETKE